MQRLEVFLCLEGHHPQVAADGEELHALCGAFDGRLGVHRVDAGGRADFLADFDYTLDQRLVFFRRRERAIGSAHLETRSFGPIKIASQPGRL